MKIGIISDTHGLLRPEAVERLAGVDHIIHAGDIGRPDVIADLRRIAPVTAVRGNIDRDEWAAGYPQTELVKLGGRFFYVLHNRAELDVDPVAAGIDVVVSGHSHQPKIETVDGVVYLNPGSAGPRRFSLPIALATIDLSGKEIRPFILTYDGQPSYTVSIMEFEDGKVARETQYFGDPFEPGPSRAQWVERMP